MRENNIRPIAIYLPQYHPIPENDEWWGKGFTEWTNVTKAKSLFKGHYQPHLPADLGFYDLRVPETRLAQAQLARKYGIYGFCYYHYWFNGRRILERPFQEVFESGSPDFPFMLCWANENWTKVWDGGEHNILLEQKYNIDDDREHIRTLIPYFKDSRYIKIDGKPVFAIYRSTRIPCVKDTIDVWREEAFKHGLELYLCRFETLGKRGKNFLEDGFDAAIEFNPDFEALSDTLGLGTRTFVRKVQNKLGIFSPKGISCPYDKMYESAMSKYGKSIDYKLYRTVIPGWDNSARRKINYLVLTDSTPQKFQQWIEIALENFVPYSEDENLFFINAWNEWAEGNHLEPDQKWGCKYLEALYAALNEQ